MSKEAFEHYLVRLVRPEGVTVKEMESYIEDAVATWKGQYNPAEDLMFYFDDATLTVKKFNQPTKKETSYAKEEFKGPEAKSDKKYQPKK